MAALSPFGEPEQYGDRTSAELSPVREAPTFERDIPLAPMAPVLAAPATPLAPLATAPQTTDDELPTEERVPPRPSLVDETRQAASDYRDLGRAKSAVNAALVNADVAIASEKDPEKRAKLIADRQQLGQAQALAAQSQQAAGEQVDLNLAKAGEAQAVAKADATLNAMDEVDAQLDEAKNREARRLKEQAATLDEAKRAQEESRAKYAATLERGPRAAAVGSTFADIISETFSAALEQRVPNYAAAAKAAWKRDRDLFAEDVRRAAGAVSTSGDRVRDVGAERDAILAEEATAQAAVIDAVTRKAELAVQRARTPLEKAQAGAVYKGLQEESERTRATAAQARLDAQRKGDKFKLDQELQRAKIGKLHADTAKSEAEGRKLARRGTGRRVPKPGQLGLYPPELRDLAATNEKVAREIVKRGVIDPWSGQYIKRDDGTFYTAATPKVAEAHNEYVRKAATANDMIEELVALRQKKGFEPTTSYYATSDGKAMRSKSAQLMALLNKDVFKLGALDAGSQDMLEQITGGNAAGLQSVIPQLRATQDGMKREFERVVGGNIVLPQTRAPKLVKPELSRRKWVKAEAAAPEDRLAAWREELAGLERKFGGVDRPDYAMQAQQSLGTFLTREAPAELAAIDKAIDAADEADDQAEFERLLAKRKATEEFANEMRRERARLRMLEGRPKSAEEAERNLEAEQKKAVREFERGDVPSGARPGA